MKNNDRFAQRPMTTVQGAARRAAPAQVKITELSNQVVLNWATDEAAINNIEQVNRQGWTLRVRRVSVLPPGSQVSSGCGEARYL